MITCTVVFVVGFALGWLVKEKLLLIKAWDKVTEYSVDLYRRLFNKT